MVGIVVLRQCFQYIPEVYSRLYIVRTGDSDIGKMFLSSIFHIGGIECRYSLPVIPEEDQATCITTLSDRTIIEGHYKVGEVRTYQGGGLRSELFTCRSVGEAGLVHQLHIGTTRLQYPLEDVPSRNDRASRTLSKPQYNEGQSDNGIADR